jgi:hypothetical protein
VLFATVIVSLKILVAREGFLHPNFVLTIHALPYAKRD